MRIAALALVVTGCAAKEPSHELRDGCLTLPAMSRRLLQADPKSNSLYWIETNIARNFDGDLRSHDRLMRFDLDAWVPHVVKEYVVGPYHFVRGGVVIQQAGAPGLVLIRDGQIQSLVPDWFSVKDVDKVDDRVLAILSEFDGKRGVYTLDLENPRPQLLAHAETLIGAGNGHVFARDADGAFSIRLSDGKRTRREWPEGVAVGPEVWHVDENNYVVGTSMIDGELDDAMVRDSREWTLLDQETSVIARQTPGVGDAFAYWIADGKATKMPTLENGTSLVGLAKAKNKTWALVAHNTSNYDGDPYTVVHEADVCQIDPKAEIARFTARFFPTRYLDKGAAFNAAVLKAGFPKATWQVVDYQGTPPSVLGIIEEPGGANLAKLREHARFVHENVTSIFGDQEMRTALEWSDGHTAEYRWRRETLRGRTGAGMGDVYLFDAADHDVELFEAADQREEDTIKCYGKLKNLRTVVLNDVEVRCIAGDRERVIKIPKIEPQATVEFSKDFDFLDNDFLTMTIFRGATELVIFDRQGEDNSQGRYDMLSRLYDDTRFAFLNHIVQDRYYIAVKAPKGWTGTASELDQLRAIRAKFDEDRGLFGAGAHPIELEVLVDRKYFAFDGLRLKPVQ